jgi:hypothetical protein
VELNQHHRFKAITAGLRLLTWLDVANLTACTQTQPDALPPAADATRASRPSRNRISWMANGLAG